MTKWTDFLGNEHDGQFKRLMTDHFPWKVAKVNLSVVLVLMDKASWSWLHHLITRLLSSRLFLTLLWHVTYYGFCINKFKLKLKIKCIFILSNSKQVKLTMSLSASLSFSQSKSSFGIVCLAYSLIHCALTPYTALFAFSSLARDVLSLSRG